MIPEYGYNNSWKMVRSYESLMSLRSHVLHHTSQYQLSPRTGHHT